MLVYFSKSQQVVPFDNVKMLPIGGFVGMTIAVVYDARNA
jgi:hypothetical protein